MAAQFKIGVRDTAIRRRFNRITKGLKNMFTEGLEEIGLVVEAKAKKMCPIGSTQSQAKAAGTGFSKGSSPGTLQNSIENVVGNLEVKIGVFHGNATKYADFIHNKQGTSWKNLGPGSEAKQGQGGVEVGGKFLDRAAADTDLEGIMEKSIKKGFKRS